MLRHLMTSWHINIWKVEIWFSEEQKELSKWNQKHFTEGTGVFLWILRNSSEHLFSQNTSDSCFWFYLNSPVLSFRITKQTSKYVADTTALKKKFSIKHFFGKCLQIRKFLRIWSHLLKKSLMENLIFCAVHKL